MKKYKKNIILLFTILLLYFSSLKSFSKDFPSRDFEVINYARSLLYSIVDTNFRGSWVVNAENKQKLEKFKKNIEVFNKLGGIEIGVHPSEVKKILNNPAEKNENEKIWIYGKKSEDGSYENLFQIFFNENLTSVVGIISFNQNTTLESVGLKIGDPIEKLINVFGEPVDKKDYYEDPDNKQYKGLYYFYPRSGVGFLIGEDINNSDPTIKGVIVFGKS